MNADTDHNYVSAGQHLEVENDNVSLEHNRNSTQSPDLLLHSPQGPANTDHDYLASSANGLEENASNPTANNENGEASIIRPAILLRLVSDEESIGNYMGSVYLTENTEPQRNETSPSASLQHTIQVLTPVHSKKRKRLSLGSPKSNTPKVKTSAGDADTDEDDGLTCPICLEHWEMSGEHRLVSLKCGHHFGDACIRRWLTESSRQSGTKMCPQCKTKAAHKDIRCLYAKRLRAIDRTEEHNLRNSLDEEKHRTHSLKTELSTLKLSISLTNKKLQQLEADNNRLKQILRNSGIASSASKADTNFCYGLANYKLFLDRNIEVSREPGCRVMTNANKNSTLIVSQKSSQALFPGYGLRFIDTPTFRPTNFLHTSGKLLRDIALNNDQQMLAVASMEPRTKVFDLRTRQMSTVFTSTDNSVSWACAMDSNEREHFIYIGANLGSTYIYDIRSPEVIVDEFKTEGDLSPVINIAPVSSNTYFPNGGFVVCKLQSIWFHEYMSCSGTVTSTRFDIEGPFISMKYDENNDTLLISARNGLRCAHSRYILGKLEKIDETPVFNTSITFFGSKVTPVMTRCTQIAVESNTLVAGYMQDVKFLALFDEKREQRVHTMPVSDIVYDICPVYMGSDTYLAALTENKCRIYKLMLSS